MKIRTFNTLLRFTMPVFVVMIAWAMALTLTPSLVQHEVQEIQKSFVKHGPLTKHLFRNIRKRMGEWT